MTTKQAASTSTDAKLVSRALSTLFLPVTLSLAVFLYVWLRIEPALEHHSVGPFFFASSSYFEPFPHRPGGLVEYLAAFLGHLNHFSWLGAAVFSLLCLLLFLGTRRLLREVGGVTTALPLVCVVLLLLLLRNRYGSPALTVGVGLLVGVLVASARLMVGSRHVAVRLFLTFMGAGIVFYLAGAWACLMFALMTGLAEGRRGESWFLGAASVLLGLAPCAVFLAAAGTAPASLFNPLGSTEAVLGLVAAIHLLAPLAVGIALLLPESAGPVPAQQLASRSKSHKPLPGTPWFQSVGVNRALTVLLLVAGAAAAWFTFDVQRKARARIDYLADRQEYARLIAHAATVRSFDLSSQIDLYLALCKSGVLCSNLFHYGFPRLPELLPGVVGGLPSCRAQSQTLLELGLISDAEHLAHEALEFEGNRPDLLRTLAIVNVLKGRPRAARVFLNVLNQVPFERKWASARLRDIESSPSLASDPEVSRIRSCLLTNDLPHSGLPGQALLSRLLMTNPQNKMAFEYLLALYLVDLNLAKAAEAILILDSLGYQSIPRHLEEALLLHERLNGAKVDLRGRRISTITLKRFDDFVALLNRLPDQSAESRRALGRDFGDTYWFYHLIKEADAKASEPKPPVS